MDIKEIRKEFKKLVIMGCNPECKTYEDALCRGGELMLENKLMDNLAMEFSDNVYVCDRVWAGWEVGTMNQDSFTILSDDDEYMLSISQVIYSSITLERVLCLELMQNIIICVNKKDKNFIDMFEDSREFEDYIDFCSWELTKTDDDQTDECIEALYNILK